ncbi:hypothetical protein F2P79_014698 [Pimephales promelas]|nr:hypothetical protein F2P79_014698 [Pimephales promelas]
MWLQTSNYPHLLLKTPAHSLCGSPTSPELQYYMRCELHLQPQNKCMSVWAFVLKPARSFRLSVFLGGGEQSVPLWSGRWGSQTRCLYWEFLFPSPKPTDPQQRGQGFGQDYQRSGFQPWSDIIKEVEEHQCERLRGRLRGPVIRREHHRSTARVFDVQRPPRHRNSPVHLL